MLNPFRLHQKFNQELCFSHDNIELFSTVLFFASNSFQSNEQFNQLSQHDPVDISDSKLSGIDPSLLCDYVFVELQSPYNALSLQL